MAYKRIPCIYCIENVINGKKYYGSTRDFRERKNRHLRELNNKKHHNIFLQRAWDKYGSENFIFKIIEMCDLENLFEREEYFILKDNPEYNLGAVGGGDLLSNHPNKEEIIKKRSKTINKNIKKLSQNELNKKYGKSMEKNGMWKGGITKKQYICEECNKPISLGAAYKDKKNCISCCKKGNKNPFAGKRHSDKTKKELSDQAKKRYSKIDRKELSCTGAYLVEDGEKKQIYYSLSIVGNVYGVTPGMILYVIKSKKILTRGKLKGVKITKVDKNFTLN